MQSDLRIIISKRNDSSLLQISNRNSNRYSWCFCRKKSKMVLVYFQKNVSVSRSRLYSREWIRLALGTRGLTIRSQRMRPFGCRSSFLILSFGRFPSHRTSRRPSSHPTVGDRIVNQRTESIPLFLSVGKRLSSSRI